MKPLIARLGFSLVSIAALTVGCGNAANQQDDDPTGQTEQSLCTGIALAANDADRIAVPGQLVTWTATPTCTGTPEYRFNLRAPNGTWTVARDWGPSNTYAWDTASQALGSYNMQLWVRDAAAPPTFQKYVGVYFELRAVAPCTAASTTVTPASAAPGTNITVATSATTCSAAEYAIYKKAPGGAFLLLSPYSQANANYVWNSAGAPLGIHTFQVWARSLGSTVSYEVKAATKTATIQSAGPCTPAALNFAPVTTAAVGTNVALTASAGGCASPTFKFFIKPPGGVYQVLQDWTASPIFSWNTNFAPAGAYQFQVYSRNAGSTATYESFVTKNYALTASTPTSALAIGGGWQHHCQLLADGRVGCWGYNGHGETGSGTITTSKKVPVAATGVTQGIALGVGYYHTCVLVYPGTAKCWGQNNRGQLGNGGTATSSTPVAVTGLSGAVSISGGIAHTCAALGTGDVRCWGYNSQGQLGDGTRTNRSTPVNVPITNATQTSGGYYHSCALLRTGTVTCWGYNANGQLGDGSTTTSLAPVPVSGLSNVVSISSFNNNNCAVKDDGTIWCWGANSAEGVLGSGMTATQTTPLQVSGIANARSASVGEAHSCAVLQTGQAMCWGSNFYGALGDGTNTNSPVPVPVSTPLNNVTSVGVSNGVSCATLSDNTASCWGRGDTGELGNGGTASSNVPVAVTALP